MGLKLGLYGAASGVTCGNEVGEHKLHPRVLVPSLFFPSESGTTDTSDSQGSCTLKTLMLKLTRRGT